MRNTIALTRRANSCTKAVGLAVLSALIATIVNGQTAVQKPQLPQRIVYWQLFRHANFLQQQATLADQSGQDGSKLRNYYQTRAALTATEAALFNQVASTAAAKVQAIDQQIQAVVTQFRTGFQATSKTGPPSPPAELATLQAQRDQAVLDQLTALQSGLGASRFQQFDTYVHTNFAPHITVTKATPAPPSDPTKFPLAPVQ